jgi:hypothetical protein
LLNQFCLRAIEINLAFWAELKKRKGSGGGVQNDVLHKIWVYKLKIVGSKLSNEIETKVKKTSFFRFSIDFEVISSSRMIIVMNAW